MLVPLVILINFCPFENAYDFILSMLRGGKKIKKWKYAYW